MELRVLNNFFGQTCFEYFFSFNRMIEQRRLLTFLNGAVLKFLSLPLKFVQLTVYNDCIFVNDMEKNTVILLLLPVD